MTKDMPDARVVQPPSVVEEDVAPAVAEESPEEIMGFIHSSEMVGSVNGPGIRYTLYLSGCPLRCLYCHNPDTWQMRMGERVSVASVVEDIGRYAHFISVAGGGLTVSGGEPTMQGRFLTAVMREVKERYGMHTALDTSGFLESRISDELLDLVDIVLLDIKSGIPEVYTRLTSVDMEPTVRLAQRLSARGNTMWVRFVMVPGLTDADDNVAAVADIVASLDHVERVEVLPYHEYGEQKYEALGWVYPLHGQEVPSKERVEEVKAIFAERGITVY
jgi:pyruvate formate lyase activating enzyme